MSPRSRQENLAGRIARAADDNAYGAAYIERCSKRRFSFGETDEELRERVENLENEVESLGGVAPSNLTRRDPNDSLRPSTSSHVGRKQARPAEFLALAAELWRGAQLAPGAKVSHDQLRHIASVLDEAGFVPPAGYLEPSFAKQLRAFNSRHSNSKDGPIKTWTRLVEHGDSGHLRGMRKLLSRCAKCGSSVVRK